jgi:hypothetical protein
MYILAYTYNVKGEHKDIFYCLESEKDCQESLQYAKDMWGKDLREWYITKVISQDGFVK